MELSPSTSKTKSSQLSEDSTPNNSADKDPSPSSSNTTIKSESGHAAIGMSSVTVRLNTHTVSSILVGFVKVIVTSIVAPSIKLLMTSACIGF